VVQEIILVKGKALYARGAKKNTGEKGLDVGNRPRGRFPARIAELVKRGLTMRRLLDWRGQS